MQSPALLKNMGQVYFGDSLVFVGDHWSGSKGGCPSPKNYERQLSTVCADTHCKELSAPSSESVHEEKSGFGAFTKKKNTFPLFVCDCDTFPHLVSNFLIFSFCVLGLLQKPLCPLSAASRCLWGVLNQPLGQVSEVDHLRLQGPQTLLLTPQSLQTFSTACLMEEKTQTLKF